MDLRKLPKTEFAAAIAQIAGERKIDAQLILDSIELGLIAAYKRDLKEHSKEFLDTDVFMVDLDAESGSFHVYNISDKNKKIDVTPPGFGRIAAQTAMQVINQRISEAERDTVLGDYEKRIGSLISGTVLRADSYKLLVSIGQTEGVCPKDEQIHSESLSVGSRKLFLIKSLHTDPETSRRDIILSRKDPEFIRQLFLREVPEVGSKMVKVEKIARASGSRSKVAVSSSQTSVDPVGSCIGQKGSRIQSILNELPSSEKVDVILYSKNLSQFAQNALSPASGAKTLDIDKASKVITVSVPEDQLALAIGSNGDNVRLAGELVDGYDIKVEAEKA